MKPQCFIFMGRSGSGKGTQAKLVMDLLKKIDPSTPSLYIQTGEEFRKFIQGETVTQKMTKTSYDRGDLMPEFLVIYQWVKVLIEKYSGNEHIVFDGTPRKIHEAGVLNSVFGFYRLPKPWVINIEVGGDESLRRLLARGRFDDKEQEIKRRLSWYETEVAPVVEYYRGNPDCNFLSIDGEKSVGDIHADIVKKLKLS